VNRSTKINSKGRESDGSFRQILSTGSLLESGTTIELTITTQGQVGRARCRNVTTLDRDFADLPGADRAVLPGATPR
jgi:hypothetical protein